MLAAAASNIAVDNLVERLRMANPKLMVVRVGHPARLLPQARLFRLPRPQLWSLCEPAGAWWHFPGKGCAPRAPAQVLGASLEAHVYASDNSSLARDCRRDIKAASAQLLKLGRKVHGLVIALRTAPCGTSPTPEGVLCASRGATVSI